jgi:hypothetical protein
MGWCGSSPASSICIGGVHRQSSEMKFSIEQRVFIVESFARKKTYTKCICKFRRKYPDSPVPTALCVSKLVKRGRPKVQCVWSEEI